MSLRSRAAAYVRAQNEHLDVEPVEVFLPALPPALDGYRLAIVSDLHITRHSPYLASILNAVRRQQPDCILIAGDSIDERTQGVLSLEPFFTLLAQTAPTVAILGNNDCLPSVVDALRSVYWQSGITLLENETRLLNARGYPMQITGLLDPFAQQMGIEAVHRQINTETPTQMPLSGVLPPKEEKTEGYALPSVLLLHQPQLAYAYAELRPSLIISGHAHGGQIRLPHGQGLYAPGQGLFPRLTGGLYDLDGTRLLVSRGLGNHRFPLRLNNRPHLPVAILRRGV